MIKTILKEETDFSLSRSHKSMDIHKYALRDCLSCVTDLLIYDHTEAKNKDVSLIWTVDAFSWLTTSNQPTENLFSCLSVTKSVSFSYPKIKQLILAVIRRCFQAEARINATSAENLILFCVFFFLIFCTWVKLAYIFG